MRALVVVAVIAWAATARAQSVEPAVVGTWVAPLAGFNMVFDIRADGSCVFDEEHGRCTAKDGTLVWTGPEGTERYRYTVSGNTLSVSGGDIDTTIAFQRKGGAAKTEPARKEPVVEEAPPPPAKGPGVAFSKESWGVKLTAPPGWKLGEKDGMVFGGHDSEAGLLIIKYEPRTTREQIIAEYQKGLNEQGLSASPSTEAKSWKSGSASGIAGEYTGATGDGTAIKIRSIALLNSYGGALIVAGLTTPDKYPNLKTRVEQLAATVVMQKPKESGAIAGAYAFMYISKSGSYSREAYLTLCRSGRFTRRGEMVGSGANGSAYSGRGNAGSWRAQGDANGGTLVLEFEDGSSAQVIYRTSTDPKDRSGYGAGVYFGNDLYQKTGAGDC